jgi:glycosyltransferase involved in cell wall biosynthesis
MHVMHVIDSMHGGGAETSLLELVPTLASRGVRTSVVTLLTDDGGLEGRLAAVGIEPRRLTFRDPIRLIRELRNVINSELPDLLHTTLMFANLTGRIAARPLGTPVVTTLANLDYGPEHRSNSRYGSWGVRAAQSADVITAPLTRRFHAISAEVASVMRRRLGIPRDRIEVVYRGRDPARLGTFASDRRVKVRAALGMAAGAPVVLSAARLDRQKGVETTVEAFRYLAARIPEAVLLVAGRPGDASAVVEARAGGVAAIRLLGHRTDIPDLMCAADVLSFPSRWEGLGGTLVEAMALRLGIVASDIGPVAEAIGDVGWPLVRPDDAPALAEGLASVLAGGAANDSRKDAGEKRFRRVFTADAVADGMINFYQNALRDTPTRRSVASLGAWGRWSGAGAGRGRA